MVNGMIVDGLGHVSLDSGNSAVQQQQQQQQQQHGAHAGSTGMGPAIMNQANIHQGSILATGRKTDGGRAGGSNAGSAPTTPMSCANSLQFNQLIGGGVAPSLVTGANGTPAIAAAAAMGAQQQPPMQGLNLVHPAAAAAASVNPNLLIGDYVQAAAAGVLGNNAPAAAAGFRQ